MINKNKLTGVDGQPTVFSLEFQDVITLVITHHPKGGVTVGTTLDAWQATKLAESLRKNLSKSALAMVIQEITKKDDGPGAGKEVAGGNGRGHGESNG